ncbi:MAG: hypothetical protein K2L80_09475 [Muribaculaceae bacterium]|nr:hypothetical protein [Muribaculaceae bacterium]MDE6332818.1 hypothetical protein [Muribaculaceae bacterium]
MTELHQFLTDTEAEKLICLDAEFADGRYMLELSVSDARGKLIYNQRFRPDKISDWGTVPHGITPAMVADAPLFKQCVPEIQRIIDKAEYITGFALINDFRRLSSEGISIAPDKKIIELKDWFWTLYGRDKGFDYQNGISNQSVATELGIEVDEEKLHGSDYDIELSLSSLNRLLQHASAIQARSLDEFYDAVTARFRVYKEEYDREQSAGFCSIQQKENGYWIKFNKKRPRESASLVAVIEVESRKEAMLYMSKLFLNHIEEGSFFIDKLTKAKLQKFKEYSNTFSAEDREVQSKLLKLASKFSASRQ